MMATRLWQNTAKVHFDATFRDDGRRLIYGGHVISMARALSFNGLANAQMIVGAERRRACQPVLRRRHDPRLVRGAGHGRDRGPGRRGDPAAAGGDQGGAPSCSRARMGATARRLLGPGLLGADAGLIVTCDPENLTNRSFPRHGSVTVHVTGRETSLTRGRCHMPRSDLPRAPEDILSIPAKDMPDIVRSLVRERRLSPLMARIHSDLRSDDTALRKLEGRALRRLGFTD